MSRKDNTEKNRFSKSKNLIIVLCLLLLLGVGGVFAKYVFSGTSNPVLVAKEFYFTSNFLEKNNVKYILNSKSDYIELTIRNHEDNLRFAEDDIEYTVTMSENNLRFADSNEALTNSLSGKLTGNTLDSDTIYLSYEGLERGKEYKITATGNAGYKKTISATVEIAGNNENVFMYEDRTNSEYILLTVWSENVSGNLSIKFPKGLIPDATDPIMENVINYNNGVYDAGIVHDDLNFSNTYSSKTYRFFISDEYISTERITASIKSGDVTYNAADANPN